MVKKTLWGCILGMAGLGLLGCGGDDKEKTGGTDKNANGEPCAFGLECVSGYCSPDRKCADAPVVIEKKPNGQSCVSPAECESMYCSTNWVCANAPKNNGESCTAADDCTSHFCNDRGICADAPKSNGSPCSTADECASQYCGSDGLCANEPKANGEDCANAKDCISRYCSDAGICADAPKENGEKCTKADECISRYCNESGVCAKAPGKNGESCTVGTDCVSRYCDSDGLCADKPHQDSEVLDLQQVPDTQDNTDGVECDPKTFVQHCADNHIVWCNVDDDGKSVVKSDNCDGDYPMCLLTLLDGRNHAVCVGEKSECKKGDKDDNNCETDKNGYIVSHSFQCMQFQDGKYYYGYVGIRYCSGKCTKTICKQETCDPTAGHACSEDLKYTKECYEHTDGTYIYKSFNCSDDGSKCTVMENWATCI